MIDMTVVIPLDNYLDLLNAKELLDALKAQGVDNWEGYSLAVQELNKEKEND